MGPFVPNGKRSSDKGFLANGFVAVDPSLRRRMFCMEKPDWIYSVYYYVPSLNLNGRCGCFSRNEWRKLPACEAKNASWKLTPHLKSDSNSTCAIEIVCDSKSGEN